MVATPVLALQVFLHIGKRARFARASCVLPWISKQVAPNTPRWSPDGLPVREQAWAIRLGPPAPPRSSEACTGSAMTGA
eukprot:3899159-Rhodomonas_salina.1